MTYVQHGRAVLVLGLPLVGGHLAQFAIGLTDSIMMGWYGVAELAAMTLAGSLFFSLLLFGSGFAFAVMPMVADYATKNDDQQIRRATRMALWWSGLFFAAVMPLMWFSGTLLSAVGQEVSVAQNAQTYLRIAGWGMLPALGVMVLKSYLAGLEHTRIVLWITVASAVVNAFANYALIFGNWGAPELGLQGAAIASVLSTTAGLLLTILYALRKLPQHQLFVRFWKSDGEMFARIFRLGLPIGLTTLAEVALFAISAVLMGWLGEVPLAAHGAALQIASATFMMHVGLSNAATIRAGNAKGRQDADHLIKGAKVVTFLSLCLVALATSAFLLFPETLLGIFFDPKEEQLDELLRIGTILLALAALFQLVDAMQVIHLGLLRGLLDTQVPMIMAAIAYWGIGLPSAYIFGFVVDWGAAGIWIGLVLGLAVAAALLMYRFWTKGSGPLFVEK
ncbi:Multidrug resistance protein MdtK [Pelagimonas phthalicica]|uniref:Multidrug-efflux transporter n=1 Tax=Pelagimonas phthalicica TaxID=1037362 RepID=A0A238JEK2_9RHOB|nr:MATE family efflux transporter [Pelagimonas phthalicica]TDS92050.1 MATE family multidrug resistance protein [Pelagimonas phthalicica]SMX29100.1 Multidrug resistance protein MdtK [Pelagimonas phthalicica]